MTRTVRPLAGGRAETRRWKSFMVGLLEKAWRTPWGGGKVILYQPPEDLTPAR